MEITWLGILAIAILFLQDMADIVKVCAERHVFSFVFLALGILLWMNQSVCE